MKHYNLKIKGKYNGELLHNTKLLYNQLIEMQIPEYSNSNKPNLSILMEKTQEILKKYNLDIKYKFMFKHEIDGYITNNKSNYTFYNYIVDKNDKRRFLEDITMGYYRLNNGKAFNVYDMLKLIGVTTYNGIV